MIESIEIYTIARIFEVNMKYFITKKRNFKYSFLIDTIILHYVFVYYIYNILIRLYNKHNSVLLFDGQTDAIRILLYI